jgi:integrase
MSQQMRPSAYHLRPSDIRKLILAAANFRDRTLIKALWWLGLRRHELVALDIRDIDFERKRVTVRAGKGGKTRVIPIIDDEFMSDLKHLIGPRVSGPLFTANGHQAMSLRLVNTIVQKVGESAGVTNPNPGRAHLNPHIFGDRESRNRKPA